MAEVEGVSSDLVAELAVLEEPSARRAFTPVDSVGGKPSLPDAGPPKMLQVAVLAEVLVALLAEGHLLVRQLHSAACTGWLKSRLRHDIWRCPYGPVAPVRHAWLRAIETLSR